MDISLDLNKSSETYRDLILVNGDLCFTSDQDPNGTDPVLQDVLQALSFFYQEWYLDNSQGIPYLQQVFVKNPDTEAIDAIFKNVIAGRPGVAFITYYSSQPPTAQRAYFVQFKATKVTGGVISWSGNFPINGGTTE